MDRSIATLSSPPLSFPGADRRRRLRHKLNTPVYVSFNGPQTGIVFDLSELLDLNEDGFCVQAASSVGLQSADGQSTDRLEVNHPVSLCLDLPETKNLVHGGGVVVWRDDGGRAGIRFSPLPDVAMAVLKEWLFVNQLIACTNYEARAEQLAHRRQEESSAGDRAPAPELVLSSTGATAPNRAQLLSDLDDVRREVREIRTRDMETGEDNADAICQLITERAMTLTGASGSALALLTDGRMVCRRRAGDPAPPPGSEVDVREGLSGECVRTGQRVLCEDTDKDARVDAELCRALGVRSVLATPVVSGLRVIGLLEVFSPHAGNFSNTEAATLERLAELISWTNEQKVTTKDSGPANTRPDVAETIAPHTSELPPTEYSAIEPSIGPSKMPSGEETGTAADGTTKPGTASPAAEARNAAPKETTVLDDLRTALWERGPELERQKAADCVQEGHEGVTRESFPALPSHWGHLGLILSALAAAALALGYLLAPVIERHLNNTAQSRQNPPVGLPVSFHGADPSKVQAATPDDLHKLAEQGDAEAQFMLGTLYRNGDGVLQNDTQAIEWFQRAAEQGYVRALSALGSSYWAGRGVRQDYSQAYFWYELALAKGDQNSKSLLEGISPQLTREQVANARQQAEAWLQAHNQPGKIASN
ncbi:MAG: GAF domain-containing protein [Terriglobales bacterium]